jgi:hypothetical protein
MPKRQKKGEFASVDCLPFRVVGGFPYRVQCFRHMVHDINETVEYEGTGREMISYTIDLTYAVHMLFICLVNSTSLKIDFDWLTLFRPATA